ncbi:MAG: cytochrome c oxidase subunit II [Thermoanaerobaculia bacterium]
MTALAFLLVRLFPVEGSSMASRVDSLYFFLLGLCGFVSFGIFVMIVYYSIKYRAGAKVDRSNPVMGSYFIETSWAVIPFLIFLFIFAWGAKIYFDEGVPPKNASPIYVVAKQWMWKIQHPNGRREIDELHLEVNQPVRLLMISEDVIHSFYVPQFRQKQDVLPRRYTSLWFQPTKVGTYDLECAEYCGTNHSRMIGHVVVMTPEDYQRWLSGETRKIADNMPMVEAGRVLYNRFGCVTCHESGGPKGPSLVGLSGRTVRLADGRTIVADESYLRESILQSHKKVVAGYDPLMPVFQGQMSETEVMELIAFIKSMEKSEPSDVVHQRERAQSPND